MSVKSFYYNVKNKISVYYLLFIGWLAVFMVHRANDVLRHLIVLKGKNPDYLPPPPPKPIVLEEKPYDGRLATLSCNKSHFNVHLVQNPKEHSVLQSRHKFENPDLYENDIESLDIVFTDDGANVTADLEVPVKKKDSE